ncbi:MAG: hypothetical protein HC902_10915 [Calothrix sp. SM1_5_4]|nr:hypothetical protein [Calothrix sp. SM1_5_4]
MPIIQLVLFLCAFAFSPAFASDLASDLASDDLSEESPPVIIQTLTKLIPRMSPALAGMGAGDLVIFDLDNTVFANSTSGDRRLVWLCDRKEVERGFSRSEAAARLVALNKAIKPIRKCACLRLGCRG